MGITLIKEFTIKIGNEPERQLILEKVAQTEEQGNNSSFLVNREITLLNLKSNHLGKEFELLFFNNIPPQFRVKNQRLKEFDFVLRDQGLKQFFNDNLIWLFENSQIKHAHMLLGNQSPLYNLERIQSLTVQ